MVLPAVGLFLGGTAQAASQTWNSTGASAIWSSATNWGGNTAPGNTTSGVTASPDVATFNSAVGTVGVSGNPITIDTGRTISGMTFDTASVGSFFIGTGATSLYLSSGGAIQMTTTAIASNETINAPLIIAGAGATYSFTNNSTSTGTLNFGGQISGGTAGATVLTLNGTSANTNTISGNIINGSATSVALTINPVVTGGASTWALSGTNTYSGGTTVTTGALDINSISAIGTGTLTLATGVTIDNTSLNAITLSTTNTVAVSGNFTFGGTENLNFGAGTASFAAGSNTPTITLNGVNSSLTFGGASFLASSATNVTFTVNGSGNTLNLGGLSLDPASHARNVTVEGSSNVNITGAVINGGTVAATLTYAGTGKLDLTGTNTYTGVTALTSSGGTLQFGQEASLYNDATASWTATNITAKSGSVLAFNVGGTGEFTTGDVTTLLTNLDGAVNSDGLESGSSIGFDTTNAAGGSFTIANVIQNSTSNGGGPVGVIKLGTNTLTLSNTNTYTGATKVANGDLSVTGSLASGSAVTVGNNTAVAAILSGTGTVNGSLTTATTGSNVAYIAPGVNISGTRTDFGSAGTLHVGGALTIGTGSALDFDLSGSLGSGNDLITMTGTGSNGVLTIGSTLTVNINQLSGSTLLLGSQSSNDYTLIGGATSLVGGGSGSTTYTTSVAGSTDIAHVFTSGNNLDVYFTAGGASPTTYTLGVTAGSNLLHVGGTTTLTSTITNNGGSGADTLDYNGLGASSSLSNGTGTASGTGGPLANSGGSASNASTYTATNAGTDTVTSTVTSATNATVGGNATLSGTAGTTSINVYSGLSTWNTNGGGTWGTLASNFGTNWGATQGSPGVTSGFANTDTATFDNTVLTAGHSATVTLDGATPSLKAITFGASGGGTGAGYTIAVGTPTTGSISLDGNGGNATVTNSGTNGSVDVIAVPVTLTTSANVNVASGQTINFSGAISGGGGLSTVTGTGTTILSNSSGNGYSGGTTASAGALYVTNTTGSGTGSGSVGVSNSGTLLAGTGKISGAVTLGSGTSLYSGGVPTGTPSVSANTVSSTTGLTLSSTLAVSSANLTFALGTDTTSGSPQPYGFGNPSYNSTYMNVGGVITFSGTDSVSLVDLTNTTGSNGSLTLRQGTPYLLIADTLGNSGFSGLVTVVGTGATAVYSLDQNGYVVGVAGAGWVPADGATDITQIQISQFGASGTSSPLTAGAGGLYADPVLYLNNGDLEVVPEPGTWALMLAGLGVLIFWQRRRQCR